ncbi:unnamed protein product [Didymodactylos carnosus]|uniref:Uncharacterized protein n=1 Tax=Didymodactylos carnosus TaxID=1234261 RepID=A0A8S2P2Y8_9BILA|nr:unnamed protein product [Didymodactylos carnosus]CAF4032825.1 unnamed protein product [Didymodactylos carnosus]
MKVYRSFRRWEQHLKKKRTKSSTTDPELIQQTKEQQSSSPSSTTGQNRSTNPSSFQEQPHKQQDHCESMDTLVEQPQITTSRICRIVEKSTSTSVATSSVTPEPVVALANSVMFLPSTSTSTISTLSTPPMNISLPSTQHQQQHRSLTEEQPIQRNRLNFRQRREGDL